MTWRAFVAVRNSETFSVCGNAGCLWAGQTASAVGLVDSIYGRAREDRSTDKARWSSARSSIVCRRLDSKPLPTNGDDGVHFRFISHLVLQYIQEYLRRNGRHDIQPSPWISIVSLSLGAAITSHLYMRACCLRASCGAVYCNRSCLWVGVCVCVGWTDTMITRNCVQRSSPNWVCR